MELILILFVVAALALTANIMEQKASKEKDAFIREFAKQCPPHAWSWKPQPGVEGAQYISCDRCKMMPSITTRDEP